MKAKTWLLGLFFFTLNSVYASIDGQQMVNLNLQIKGKKKSVKSDINMPFYQTAELEKKIDNRDYYFEVNPKKGTNPNDVDIEVRLLNKNGSKIIAKKEIQAKLNKESVVSMKGVTIKVTPEI